VRVRLVAKRPGGAEGHPLRGAWRIGSRGERGRRGQVRDGEGGRDGGEGLGNYRAARPPQPDDRQGHPPRWRHPLCWHQTQGCASFLRKQAESESKQGTRPARRPAPPILASGNTSPLSQFAHGHAGCTSLISQPLAAMPTNMCEYMGKRASAHTDSKGLSIISRYRDFWVLNRGVSRLELCGKLRMCLFVAKALICW